MKLITKSLFLLPFAMTSVASAAIIVDFSTAGSNNTVTNDQGFVFSSEALNGETVSFDITVSAVIPPGGGANSANNGDVGRQNSGVGSTVENTGQFLNAIDGVSEVLRFTIGNVVGLGVGETIQVTSLLSQNPNTVSNDQTGGFGGTFGNDNLNDSITISSDISSTPVVINQSDTGDLGAILLNANNNNDGNTGNTFEHLGTVDFDTFFDVSLTGNVNNAVTIQGFQFAVVPVPEPSTYGLLGLGLFGFAFRRRR